MGQKAVQMEGYAPQVHVRQYLVQTVGWLGGRHADDNAIALLRVLHEEEA